MSRVTPSSINEKKILDFTSISSKLNRLKIKKKKNIRNFEESTKKKIVPFEGKVLREFNINNGDVDLDYR